MLNNLNSMYTKLPNLVLGFHGCDEATYNKVIREGEALKESNNKYDWLGNGIYFWENSYQRAWEWAEKNPKYKNPKVIGAVIDLGFCLNLTDYGCLELLKKGYESLKVSCVKSGCEMPVNHGVNQKTRDILLRDLDCSVIEMIHVQRDNDGEKPFDSVRGVFTEGGKAFPGSEFLEKTHIQLCVINPNCIKGYFAPIGSNSQYCIP